MTEETVHQSICMGLHDDMIQNILSFNEGGSAVNKKWKELSDKNAAIFYRPYLDTLKAHARNAYIVHPKRTQLNQVEIACGLRGPILNNIYEAFMKCGHENTLFIYDGHYHVGEWLEPKPYQKIAFIGIGKDVHIDYGQYDGYSLLANVDARASNTKIVMKNIRASPRTPSKGCLITIKGDGCKFVLKKCKVEACRVAVQCWGKRQIELYEKKKGSKVIFEDCTFVDSDCVLWQVSNGDSRITDCSFIRCGRLDRDEGKGNAVMIRDSVKRFKLTSIGNVFEDAPTPPIIANHRGLANFSPGDGHYRIYKSEEQFIIRDNILIGNNQCAGFKFDANCVYEDLSDEGIEGMQRWKSYFG